MFRLSNLHGLRQRLNNRLQIYKYFLNIQNNCLLKIAEFQSLFLLKINISFTLPSGSVYMAVILLPGDKSPVQASIFCHPQFKYNSI